MARVLASALALSIILSGPALLARPTLAQGTREPVAPARPGEPRLAAPPSTEKPAEARRPSSLDDLFARLAAAKDDVEAKGIARLIEHRFARSGSDTADLLMSRAVEALEGKDPALAIELLDRVTQLKPDWAEAWHRRAAAFYMLDDPADALADLHRAIASEPRHFNAWMALAHVRMASGDKKRALEAYRRALELHPFAEGAKAIVGRIAPQIEGRDL